jgi:hypothetical protein
MNEPDPLITGSAAAITFALLYSVCALAFALFPDATLGFIDAWFHGLDLSMLKPPGGVAWTIGTFFYGLLGVSATAFVAGFVFATVNSFLRR